jgi:Leucine-rich repeat (LRR) protein
MLSGDFPVALLSKLDELEVLKLNGNQFSGPLPTTLDTDEALEVRELDVSDNKLTGPLPFGLLEAMPELEKLNLARNQLVDEVDMRFWSTVKDLKEL